MKGLHKNDRQLLRLILQRTEDIEDVADHVSYGEDNLIVDEVEWTIKSMMKRGNRDVWLFTPDDDYVLMVFFGSRKEVERKIKSVPVDVEEEEELTDGEKIAKARS